MPTKITVLGSGTSMGVPTIGCHCDVCTSSDPRDNRLRPSMLVTLRGPQHPHRYDAGFPHTGLARGHRRLDAVLFTHEHADHIMGLDDVRPFNFRQKDGIPIYASPATMEVIRRCFQYIFDGGYKESNVPRIECRLLDGAPFSLCGLRDRSRAAAARLLSHLRLPLR